MNNKVHDGARLITAFEESTGLDYYRLSCERIENVNMTLVFFGTHQMLNTNYSWLRTLAALDTLSNTGEHHDSISFVYNDEPLCAR